LDVGLVCRPPPVACHMRAARRPVDARTRHPWLTGIEGRTRAEGMCRGEGGQLGHGDGQDRAVPVLIPRERLGNKGAFMAAAGGLHTVGAGGGSVLW